MNTLVRDHMTAVMERHQEPLPTPAQKLDAARRPFFLQLLAIGLEQNKDIMLAYLLRAARRVGMNSGSAYSIAIDDFLRRTVNIIKAVAASEGMALLQTILEDSYE